jgi:hypothetical protein
MSCNVTDDQWSAKTGLFLLCMKSVGLNEHNQMNKTNRMNQINQSSDSLLWGSTKEGYVRT